MIILSFVHIYRLIRLKPLLLVLTNSRLSTAPLNFQRLHPDGISPGPDLIAIFKLQRALLRPPFAESSSEECHKDHSAKGRQDVIQDEFGQR